MSRGRRAASCPSEARKRNLPLLYTSRLDTHRTKDVDTRAARGLVKHVAAHGAREGVVLRVQPRRQRREVLGHNRVTSRRSGAHGR